MTDLRDAARQALEALETVFMPHHPAVIALREALTEGALQRLSDANKEIEAVLEQPEPVFYAPRRLFNEEVMAVIGPFRETEQEPVAWMSPASDSMIGKTDENGSAYHIITTSKKTANNAVPLYTHPPRGEWRGLKEWEINDGFDQLPTEDVCSWSFRKGVYFAEAALKEKNT